jgi:hypothetical protein
MNDIQICFSIIITPILIIYSIFEIRQGYKVIFLKQDAPSSIYYSRLFVYRIIFGNEYVERYKLEYRNKSFEKKQSAIFSFTGGILFSCLLIWYIINLFS